MTITLEKLLKESKEQHKEDLADLDDHELLALVGELVSKAKDKKVNVGLLGNKSFVTLSPDIGDPDVVARNNNKRVQIINQAVSAIGKLAEKLAQEQGGALAIDRKFDDVKEQMNAIVEDINSGRMPEFMYHRVLNVNYFDADEKESRTFFAYALPKIKNQQKFLDILKLQLGDQQFNSYLSTSNYILDSGKRLDIFDLYCKDLGDLNAMERKALSDNKKTELLTYKAQENARAVVQVQHVDTHQISTHKSADESHVTAFRMMLEREKLGVEATYKEPVKATDPSREVTINNRGTLDVFVTQKNAELKRQIDELVALDDAGIYNKYLRLNDLEKFKKIEYKDLTDKDKESFKKKIEGFRFQANAAKRFMDNMINDHKCNSGTYKYDTNSKATCGLTMEEMVATSYWASTDKANFKEGSGATEVGNFILLVKQLYDMRRGYDIDHGTDKPDDNEYPKELGKDSNRCQGGGVNSLSWGLKSAHKAYNPVLILRTDIEREIGLIYKEIVEKNLKLFEGKDEIIRIWNASGKITGDVREKLKKEFEEKYHKEFVDYYKGYIADDSFYNIIENALDDIPIPEQFKRVSRLEDMSVDEVYRAIKNGKLPLLHSSPERGIESTLNYLSHLNGKEDIVDKLVERAVSEDKREPSVQRVLRFLSRSNIPQAQKDVEVRNIKGKSITIGDLANLTINRTQTLTRRSVESELENLFELTENNFLEESARLNQYTLFCLYVKKVGLTDEELNKGFGSNLETTLLIAIEEGDFELVKELLKRKDIDVNKGYVNYQATPLNSAAYHGHVEVVKELLKRKDVDVNKADNSGYTPLNSAAREARVEVVKELLKRKDVDVNKADNSGYTPLYWAARNGNVEVVKELLKRKDIDVNKGYVNHQATPLNSAAYHGHVEVVNELLKHRDIDVNKADNSGYTPLYWAARNGNVEVVKELLKRKDIDVNKADIPGNPPLNSAASSGNVEVVKVFLAHGASPSLNMLLNNTFSSEMNSQLRSTYISNITSYIFSPIINIFKGVGKAIARLFTGSKDRTD